MLPWEVWQAEVARMDELGVTFLDRPSVDHAGTEDAQAKAYLADPSGNVIELKAYQNVERTLRLTDES